MKNRITNVALTGLVLILLTGCTKSYTCILENTKVEITFKNGKVSDMTTYATFESEELANNMCPIVKMTVDNKEDVICNDKEIKVTNYQNSLELDNLKTKTVLEYFKEQNFTCE